MNWPDQIEFGGEWLDQIMYFSYIYMAPCQFKYVIVWTFILFTLLSITFISRNNSIT